MLDSKEVATEALFRAEMMRAYRKGRILRRTKTAVMLLCACALTAALVSILRPPLQPYTLITDEQSPLAALPFEEVENKPSFSIPGYSDIAIPAGETDVKIMLPNYEDNTYCLSYEIILEATGKVLYASTPIQPASYVEDLTLSTKLEEGEHRATLIITAFEPGGATAVGEVAVRVIITAYR